VDRDVREHLLPEVGQVVVDDDCGEVTATRMSRRAAIWSKSPVNGVPIRARTSSGSAASYVGGGNGISASLAEVGTTGGFRGRVTACAPQCAAS
jgi:hypothetical protein